MTIKTDDTNYYRERILREAPETEPQRQLHFRERARARAANAGSPPLA